MSSNSWVKFARNNKYNSNGKKTWVLHLSWRFSCILHLPECFIYKLRLFIMLNIWYTVLKYTSLNLNNRWSSVDILRNVDIRTRFSLNYFANFLPNKPNNYLSIYFFQLQDSVQVFGNLRKCFSFQSDSLSDVQPVFMLITLSFQMLWMGTYFGKWFFQFFIL